MAKRVQKKPDFLDSIVPDFAPHCRRLTSAPGCLEALCEDNVDYIRQPTKKFTTNGIETTHDTVREVDAVFCATGTNIDAAPAFAAAKGIDLKTAWQPDGRFGFPYTYLGLATPGFPNLLFVYGPHASIASGSVTYNIENQLTYYAKLLRKVSSQEIKSMAPSSKAADVFVGYNDTFSQTDRSNREL